MAMPATVRRLRQDLPRLPHSRHGRLSMPGWTTKVAMPCRAIGEGALTNQAGARITAPAGTVIAIIGIIDWLTVFAPRSRAAPPGGRPGAKRSPRGAAV
jgi:hypothetical protein